MDNHTEKSLGDIVSDIIDDVIDSPSKQHIFKHHIISKDLTKHKPENSDESKSDDKTKFIEKLEPTSTSKHISSKHSHLRLAGETNKDLRHSKASTATNKLAG